MDNEVEQITYYKATKAGGVSGHDPKFIYHLGLNTCPDYDEQTSDTAPFISWVERVEAAIRGIRRPLSVAVMGCEVNGPGEARQADVGIAIGKGRAAIFKHGQLLRTVPLERALDELLKEIERTW